ncbi:MAG: UTRA domain-containing protein [Egibacteraceae bacterium]
MTEHGLGSFVRARRPLRRLGSPRHFQADEGGDADGRLLGVEVTAPPAEVAERLGLAPDELALVRRHLLLFKGEPAGLVDRYLPLRVAQPASAGQAERIAGAAPAECERVVEELTLRMPTPEEARRLGMSAGAPVVRVLAPVTTAREACWRSPISCWRGIGTSSCTRYQRTSSSVRGFDRRVRPPYFSLVQGYVPRTY